MEVQPDVLRRWSWMAFFRALAVTLPLIWWNDLPQRDLACRYAPMAEALACGDWFHAFHPRIPPLATLPAGALVALFGINGILACKLVSSIFFAASVFPLAAVYRRCVGVSAAVGGILLTVFCSHLIRLGASGLRDTIKTFAFAIAVYALLVIWERRRQLAGYLWLAVGCALMIMTRGDCLLYAGCFGLTALCFELRARLWPWRAMLAGGVILLLIAPQLLVNWHYTGYPVPEIRFAVLLEQLMSEEPAAMPSAEVAPLTQAEAPPTPQWTAAAPVSIATSDTLGDFLASIFKGFYPLFAIPALVAAGWRIRRKLWRPEETIVMATVFAHAFLVIGQMVVFERKMYVSDRYLTSVSPLLFGWSAWGVLSIWSWCKSHQPRWCRPWLAAVALTLLGAGLLADAAMPTIRLWSSRSMAQKRRAIQAVAAWIREDYRGPSEGSCAYQPLYYHSNRRPWVMAPGLEQIGYLAGGGDLQIFDPEFTGGRVRPDYLVTPDRADWQLLVERDFVAVYHSDSRVVWIPKMEENR